MRSVQHWQCLTAAGLPRIATCFYTTKTQCRHPLCAKLEFRFTGEEGTKVRSPLGEIHDPKASGPTDGGSGASH